MLQIKRPPARKLTAHYHICALDNSRLPAYNTTEGGGLMTDKTDNLTQALIDAMRKEYEGTEAEKQPPED